MTNHRRPSSCGESEKAGSSLKAGVVGVVPVWVLLTITQLAAELLSAVLLQGVENILRAHVHETRFTDLLKTDKFDFSVLHFLICLQAPYEVFFCQCLRHFERKPGLLNQPADTFLSCQGGVILHKPC